MFNRLIRCAFVSLLVAWFFPISTGWGDALVVTRAMNSTTILELSVDDEGIRAELEIGKADQAAFKSLIRQGEGGQSDPGETRPAVNEQTWAELRVLADGKPVAGRVTQMREETRVPRDEVTGDPLVPQGQAGEPVLRIRVEYPLSTRPKTLVFQPPQTTGDVTASVGFICYHRGLPVNDFRYMTNKVTIDLDWEDPWYSSFRHPNLRRQFESPLSAFLYVEPYEVRQEVILRPMDLRHWTNIRLPEDGRLPVDRQEKLKQEVVAFLIDKNPVEIDGVRLEPRLERINFIHRTLRTTGIIDPPEDLDLTSATLGVIFYYPVKQLPDQVTMQWQLFSPRIQSVPSVASDEAGGLPTTLTPESPELRWKNYLLNPSSRELLQVSLPPARPTLSLPWVSLIGLLVLVWGLHGKSAIGEGRRSGWLIVGLAIVLIGWFWAPRFSLAHPFKSRPSISNEMGSEVLTALLYNVYRSFDHHDDAVIYDRLQESIDGDLLDQVFLETRKSMEVKNQGGLRISVKQVDVLELSEGESKDGVPVYDCRWQVSGWVGHWGHTHRRANEHVARIQLSDRGGVWKIAELEMIDQRNINEVMSVKPVSGKVGLGQTGEAERGISRR